VITQAELGNILRITFPASQTTDNASAIGEGPEDLPFRETESVGMFEESILTWTHLEVMLQPSGPMYKAPMLYNNAFGLAGTS
jgi:hypothetical protein